jgi:uncharacterized protein (UPF0371 family)
MPSMIFLSTITLHIESCLYCIQNDQINGQIASNKTNQILGADIHYLLNNSGRKLSNQTINISLIKPEIILPSSFIIHCVEKC